MRLDGWKAIAAHFGRERSTVIRWSTERGMPVYRIPGRGRGSVYALSEELDEWLALGSTNSGGNTSVPWPDAGLAPATPADPPPDARANKAWPGPMRWLVGAVAAAALGVGAYAWRMPQPTDPVEVVPADPTTAKLDLDARAEWARRTPESLDLAAGKLRRVIETDADFAPAYAALADTYILAREFGALADLDAFARAQAAVDAGMRIDRKQPDLLRAKGFLDYWWRGDREAAAESFEAALDRAPESAQTHFWYANVLVDNGDFASGLAHFDKARLLEPASVAIQADHAWARWSAGQDARARESLEALALQNPNLAVIPDYLSVMHMAQGDFPGFVEQIERMAAVRREPSLTAYAGELRRRLTEGQPELVDFMIDEALAEANRGERSLLAWPAFVASSAGDRGRLLDILRRAVARKEAWGSAGLRDHIALRWPGDPAVGRLLGQLRARSIKLGSDINPPRATSNNALP